MRRAWCLLGVAGLLLTAGLARAGEKADPRQVVEQAIKAHGGADNLSKYQAATLKGKGTLYGPKGQKSSYTAAWAWQGKDRLRMTSHLQLKGQPVTFLEVVNGAKGWVRVQGRTKPMAKELLEQERVAMYAGWLTRLVPLQGAGFKLSPAGEAEVDGRPAVGVRVERKGRPAVSLFFDKKSHLLVKSEFAVPAGKKPIVQAIFFKDYKEVQGVREAARLLINHDGRRFNESEATEIRLHERLDDDLFAEPR
jgi:hypothetical protein